MYGSWLRSGSRIRYLFKPYIRDPGSRTHIFDSLITDFWAQSTEILNVLEKIFFDLFKNKIIYNFMIFVATTNGSVADTLQLQKRRVKFFFCYTFFGATNFTKF
jgi:hypothetical protein